MLVLAALGVCVLVVKFPGMVAAFVLDVVATYARTKIGLEKLICIDD